MDGIREGPIEGVLLGCVLGAFEVDGDADGLILGRSEGLVLTDDAVGITESDGAEEGTSDGDSYKGPSRERTICRIGTV